jgi:hypothetical protein
MRLATRAASSRPQRLVGSPSTSGDIPEHWRRRPFSWLAHPCMGGRTASCLHRPMQRREVLIGLLALVVATSAIGTAHATRRGSHVLRNGDWIAYSKVPHNESWPRGGYPAGSDVFVVRQGHKATLVAGRGDGSTWNVCPPSHRTERGWHSPRGRPLGSPLLSFAGDPQVRAPHER